MARIAGINIPMNKHVVIGLTHIFGVGRSRAKDVCAAANIAPTTKVKDLTEAEVNAIRSVLQKTSHGPRHIPRPASSQGPAGSWPAHPYECPHAQGSAQAGREAECSSGQGLKVR
jgi:ribosomal protein S13